jgi:hypothetical protein
VSCVQSDFKPKVELFRFLGFKGFVGFLMIICDTSIETYMLVRTMGIQQIKDIMNIRSIRVANAQTDFESSTLF